MSTIRPLATIAILAAVGVFLAQEINKGPSHDAAELAGLGGDAAAAPAEPITPESLTAPTEPVSPAADAGLVTGVPAVDAPAFTPNTEPVAAAPSTLADPTAPTVPATTEAQGFAAIPSLPAAPSLPTNASLPASPTLPASPSGPVEPLADLPLPENIPTANYDSPSADPALTSPAPSDSPTAYGEVFPETGSAPAVAVTTPVATPVATPVVTTPPPPTAPPVPAIPAPAVASTVPAADLPPITPITPIPPTTPVVPPTAPTGFATVKPAIDAALARNELSRALLMLSSWQGDPSLTPAEQDEVNNLLSQLAGSVIYSNQHLLEGPYTVRPGDTLETIAQQYNVPWQLLGKINGVTNPALVQPGQTLKVVRGPFRATVDLGKGEIVLQVDGRYAGRFPVKLDAAPSEGTWRIEQKEGLAGKQLVLTGGPGQRAVISSQPGSISVADRDMGDLYDILSVGSEVTVRR